MVKAKWWANLSLEGCPNCSFGKTFDTYILFDFNTKNMITCILFRDVNFGWYVLVSNKYTVSLIKLAVYIDSSRYALIAPIMMLRGELSEEVFIVFFIYFNTSWISSCPTMIVWNRWKYIELVFQWQVFSIKLFSLIENR